MTTYSLAQLVADLTLDEGRRTFVYDDATGEPIKPGSIVKGNPSIGIGRNLASHGIDDTEVALLLQNDIQSDAKMLDGHIPWWRDLAENEQRVMLNLCFNMGFVKLVTFPNFLFNMEHIADIRAGRLHDGVQAWIDRACAELINSRWFGEVGERGPRMIARLHGEHTPPASPVVS